MDCSTHSPLLCHWALVPMKRPDASCRGGLNGRPCAPPRRTHPVGADAHIGPLDIDIKSTTVERTYRSVGARMARPEPGAIYEGPVADAPGSGRIYNPPLRCGWRCVRFGGLPWTRGLAGRCGHRPLRGGTIEPRRKSGVCPGGHTGRPYEETRGGSVGADFISAHASRRVGCTIAERTHRRGRCPHRPAWYRHQKHHRRTHIP